MCQSSVITKYAYTLDIKVNRNNYVDRIWFHIKKKQMKIHTQRHERIEQGYCLYI